MSKAFASKGDLAQKKITFEQLSAHCWAYTAEGDPNSGVIIGDDAILVSDATATPALARDLIARIRSRAPNTRIVALNMINLAGAPYVASRPTSV